MIERGHRLPLSRQAEMLGISRGSLYYDPCPVSAADLATMRRIDAMHPDYPFAGSRMLRDLLRDLLRGEGEGGDDADVPLYSELRPFRPGSFCTRRLLLVKPQSFPQCSRNERSVNGSQPGRLVNRGMTMFATFRDMAYSLGATALALATPLASPAQAAYMVTLEQVGSDAVATGSRSIDLPGFRRGAPSSPPK
jgi:hypothetical protein